MGRFSRSTPPPAYSSNGWHHHRTHSYLNGLHRDVDHDFHSPTPSPPTPPTSPPPTSSKCRVCRALWTSASWPGVLFYILGRVSAQYRFYLNWCLVSDLTFFARISTDFVAAAPQFSAAHVSFFKHTWCCTNGRRIIPEYSTDIGFATYVLLCVNSQQQRSTLPVCAMYFMYTLQIYTTRYGPQIFPVDESMISQL